MKILITDYHPPGVDLECALVRAAGIEAAVHAWFKLLQELGMANDGVQCIRGKAGAARR